MSPLDLIAGPKMHRLIMAGGLAVRHVHAKTPRWLAAPPPTSCAYSHHQSVLFCMPPFGRLTI